MHVQYEMIPGSGFRVVQTMDKILTPDEICLHKSPSSFYECDLKS